MANNEQGEIEPKTSEKNEVLEELNSHKQKFDEITEKLRSVEESVSKISILSNNQSNTELKREKRFVLKHEFKNVANLREGDSMKSKKQEHFNAKWNMGLKRYESHVEFYLYCEPVAPVDKWTVETKLKFRMMVNHYDEVSKTTLHSFGDEYNFGNSSNLDFVHSDQSLKDWIEIYKSLIVNDPSRRSEWERVLKETQSLLKKRLGGNDYFLWEDVEYYMIDDILTFQVEVKILKMTGFEKEKIRSFDESQKDFSDVILMVKETKFYVLKKYLALHSSYFNSLFFGQFDECQKNEIELKDIDPDDFQNFLELIYGESSFDDDTVPGILHLADMYDVPMVIRRCEEFLLKNSQKTKVQKLQLSLRFNLENLKSKCLSEIATIPDIRSIIAADFPEMDLITCQALLRKSIEFSNE
ncbi:hypothetical protein L3Y34_009537 [Caenorhabditis briggsae]|uniref:BTB domain-containing protein n=1 Tax=Caenorhabditis briggsae TaxID=6238 RepID=A0AAE9A912_CAEBR|nr:hypothetical protein L3Y34_009537 [Caenorhabditis briggsae]